MFAFLSSKPFPIDASNNATSQTHFEADPFYMLQSLSAALSAILYAFHVPERLWPGRFDILGQSHQIFHLAAFMCTWSQFVGLRLDMKHLIKEDYADRHKHVDDEFYVLTDHSLRFDSRTRVPFTNVKLSCSFVIVLCLVLNSIILAYYYHKAAYFNPWMKKNSLNGACHSDKNVKENLESKKTK